MPRAILVDMDPESLDAVKTGSLGASSFFRPENYFSGHNSTCSNFAIALLSREGKDLTE